MNEAFQKDNFFISKLHKSLFIIFSKSFKVSSVLGVCTFVEFKYFLTVCTWLDEDVMDNLGMLVIIVILIHRFIGSYDTVISTSLEGLRSLGIDICTSITGGYM